MQKALSSLRFIAGMSIVVVFGVVMADVLRLTIPGVTGLESFLPGLGTELLEASPWFMPVMGGFILTAYVAIIPLSDLQASAVVDERVELAAVALPWLAMWTAIVSVVWCLLGAFALVEGSSLLVELLGSSLIALLAAAFAALAGSTLSRDPRRRLAVLLAERRRLREQLDILRARKPMPVSGAVVTLVLWAVASYLLPAATYVIAVGPEWWGDPDLTRNLVLIAVATAFLQLVVIAATLMRPPHVIARVERVIAGFFFAAGLAMPVALAVSLGDPPADFRVGGLAVSAAFLVVALLVAFATTPGISTRVPLLRRRSPDAAIDSLMLADLTRRVDRLAPRITDARAVVDDERQRIEAEARARRTIPRVIAWFRSP